MVLLLGGFTTNFIWCVLLNIKNQTGYQYLASHVREEHAHHGGTGGGEHGPAEPAARQPAPADLKIPVLGNYLFSALAGTTLVFPVFLLHHGRNADGQIRFRLVDAAHGQHHHLQHDVGLDFPRMERLQQEGASAHHRAASPR